MTGKVLDMFNTGAVELFSNISVCVWFNLWMWYPRI